METLRDLDLVRAAPLRIALRADDADMPTMVVRFSVFDTWYEIDSYFEGLFLERTVRGAFKRTINNNQERVKVLFNHGMDSQVGDQILGDITDLREDADAAVLEARLFDGIPPLILSGLRAGAYGSSFMFRVIQEEWNDAPERSDANPKGLPERTIREARLFEAGPVTWPANPAATAGVRSMTDEFYERLRAREPHRVDALVARAQSLRNRTPDAEPAPCTSDEGPAKPADVDPTPRHSTGLTPSQRREALYDFLTTERKAS